MFPIQIMQALASHRSHRLVLLIACLGGCASKNNEVTWVPSVVAAQAMANIDKNHDGFLSVDELNLQSPGLKSCLSELDTDGDGRISEAELITRLQSYIDSGKPTRGFECQVFLHGAPLSGATVRLEPEPFFQSILPKASGKTTQNGYCIVRSESEQGTIPAGIYRVLIESNTASVPAQFNSKTGLGVEIPPSDLDHRRTSTILFKL